MLVNSIYHTKQITECLAEGHPRALQGLKVPSHLWLPSASVLRLLLMMRDVRWLTMLWGALVYSNDC